MLNKLQKLFFFFYPKMPVFQLKLEFKYFITILMIFQAFFIDIKKISL